MNCFQVWLDARKRRKEREAFARGYQWASYVISVNEYSSDAMMGFANGAFNRDAYERAFDRGVICAAAEIGRTR